MIIYYHGYKLEQKGDKVLVTSPNCERKMVIAKLTADNAASIIIALGRV